MALVTEVKGSGKKHNNFLIFVLIKTIININIYLNTYFVIGIAHNV